VNCSLAVAGAGVFVAIKATLDPGGAVNEGAFRPLTLRAPKGSIFNVRSDAPAGAHGEVRKRGVSLAMAALAQIIPDKVSGDLCGSSFPNSTGGWNQRRDRQYVYYESPAGGNGGFAGSDGPSAFVNVDFGNLPSIHNVESIENEMPLLIESCCLREDGGGEGRWRGGVGMIRRVRLLGEEGSYSVLSDRAVIPPYSVLGGGPGQPYHLSVDTARGRHVEFDTPGKVTGFPVYRDDIVVMRSSGGGGYGDPLDRPPEQVLTDVSTGYVSRSRARDGYGVVITEASTIDEAATTALRQQRREQRFGLRVIADDTIDAYVGVKGKRRILRLGTADAAALSAENDTLLEILGHNPAPLRAWARVENEAAGTVRLDAFARTVLGVADGSHVTLRLLPGPPLPNGMAG